MKEDDAALLRQIGAELETISEEAKKLLQTTDLRMGRLFDHNRIIRQLNAALLAYKKAPDEGLKKIILEFTRQLKTDILPAFTPLHPELAETAEKQLTGIRENELQDIYQLQKDLEEGTNAQLAKEKLELILRSLKEEVKLHEAKADVAKHFKDCLNTITALLEKEKTLLLHEVNLIRQTEQDVQKQVPSVEYDNLAFEWKTLSEDFERILRAEKTEVVDHIKPIFKDERKPSRLVEQLLRPFSWLKEKRKATPEEIQALIKGQKITAEDIARDIATFTNPGETSQYILQLRKHVEFLDLEARKVILSENPLKALEHSILSPAAKRFTEIAGTFAGRAAERKITELKGMAEKDELTGLHRRTPFEELLKEVFWNAKSAPSGIGTFALLFIDIDLFKLFNETYTHAVGDHVLMFVAKKIMSNIRAAEGDTACRWGGEEIVVLLPRVKDKEIARQKAEQIRSAIETESFEELKRVHREIIANPHRYNFPDPIAQSLSQLIAAKTPEEAEIYIKQVHKDFPEKFAKPPPDEQKLSAKITVSIGLALFPNDGDTPAKVIAVADTRLKRAKNAGRNQVITS